MADCQSFVLVNRISSASRLPQERQGRSHLDNATTLTFTDQRTLAVLHLFVCRKHVLDCLIALLHILIL